MNYAIELKELEKEFNTKCVLNNVNLKVKQGEILGLLGPSGAGKTTLVNILTGQMNPSKGTAFVLGEDTCKMSNEIHQKIGIMMDSFGLYERLSVYDNLKMFAKIYHVSYEKVDEVLKKVGLYDARKTAVLNLSKGMRGRLNLARAVLKEIELLFLDEPTSGLDPSTAKEIYNLLLLEKQKGTTIFLTTHNMFEAELLCDNVALLNQGNIIEYGNPKEVCKKYNYLNKIQIHLKDGRYMEFSNDKTTANEIKLLLEQELISTIHSTEPNLEHVFLERTGRRLDGI